jgi:hypothetical protein
MKRHFIHVPLPDVPHQAGHPDELPPITIQDDNSCCSFISVGHDTMSSFPDQPLASAPLIHEHRQRSGEILFGEVPSDQPSLKVARFSTKIPATPVIIHPIAILPPPPPKVVVVKAPCTTVRIIQKPLPVRFQLQKQGTPLNLQATTARFPLVTRASASTTVAAPVLIKATSLIAPRGKSVSWRHNPQAVSPFPLGVSASTSTASASSALPRFTSMVPKGSKIIALPPINFASVPHTRVTTASSSSTIAAPTSPASDDPHSPGWQPASPVGSLSPPPAPVAQPVPDQPFLGRYHNRPIRKQSWQKNIRNVAFHKGAPHLNSVGNHIAAKKVGKRCNHDGHSAMFKCFSLCDEARQLLFHEFHAIASFHEKKRFLTRFVSATRGALGRSTYEYHLPLQIGRDTRMIVVCRQFFLCTFVVSASFVNDAVRFGSATGEPPGRAPARPPTQTALQKSAHDHIVMFETQLSHYTRANTSMLYLIAGGMSLAGMYRQYVRMCDVAQEKYASKTVYYRVFKTDFKISFGFPRQDDCTVCTCTEVAFDGGTLPDTELHKREVVRMRALRHDDLPKRLPNAPNTNKRLLISVDAQQVTQLPHNTLKDNYHASKLASYNFTACVHIPGEVKNIAMFVIWHERIGGRGGDAFASAMMMVLERVYQQFPQFTNWITWSDSCVSQNRNQMISFAVQSFLQRHPSVVSIIMKYCVPSHTLIQDVDNLHQQLEKHQAGQNYNTPSALLARVFETLPAITKLHETIVMKPTDFLLFSEPASTLQYKNVPFSAVTQLRFFAAKPEVVRYEVAGGACKDAFLYTPSATKRWPSMPTKQPKLAPMQLKRKRDILSFMASFSDAEQHEMEKILDPESPRWRLQIPVAN